MAPRSWTLLHGKGIADPGLRIDWPSLMRFKRSFTDSVPANKEKAFAEKGIATYRGTARFVTEEAIGIVGQAPTAPSARS